MNDFEIVGRMPLYVFLRSKKNVHELSKYGDLAFVSSKKNYACIYINLDKSSEISNKLKKLPFVKYIKSGKMLDLEENFSLAFEETNRLLSLDGKKTGS